MEKIKSKLKQRRCRVCGVEFRVMPWSKRRMCVKCQKEVRQKLISELQSGEGEYFKRWVAGIERYVEAVGKAEEYNKISKIGGTK